MHDVSGRVIAQGHDQLQSWRQVPINGVIIVVPLYKGPDLLRRLSQALAEMADELEALEARVLFINDSPDHAELGAELDRSVGMLSPRVQVSVLTNSANEGFVRSVNRGMALALEAKCDVLLLNSDTVPRPGAFREMAAVAGLDPMIGAVSPRSNNATICDSPYYDDLRSGSADEAYAAHQYIAPYLPRLTYVPTTVGFCMLVRWLMLEEFGFFDEIYGAGYNEEIDYVRRINRCGYRAVLANHAYVHHIGEASFSQSELSRAERDEANRAILYERYPECPKTIQKYFEGPEYQAQRLLGGLIPAADGRLNILFDCRKLELYHSGTHEHMVALLSAFVASHAGDYDSYVVCDEAAFRFHRLDAIDGLVHVSEQDVPSGRFAAVMRIGQPFKVNDLELLESAAPIAGVLMLDTIALDCQHLDDTGLGILWQRLCLSLDMLGFNSRFSADQFNRRFDVPPRVAQFISLCSTDVTEYAPARSPEPAQGPILVVGNHFHHKHVERTVATLREADPDASICVLGIKVDGDGIESYESGLLSDELVASLYERARVVLLPSHYEGFGLPIMHGLARRRPVIARDLASAREIRASCSAASNLHLASTTREMVRLALQPPSWCDPTDEDFVSGSWRDAAGAVAESIARSVGSFDFTTCLSRRAIANTARLRLELAASSSPSYVDLPDPGQGYQIGRSLEERLRLRGEASEGRRLWIRMSFALRLEHVLTGSAPKPGRKLAFLKVRADDISIDLGETQRRILPWIARLSPQGRLRLRLRESTAAAEDENDPTLAARVLLIASGVSVDSLAREGHWLVLQGTKVDDWEAMLPGPRDDLHFVHYLYRHMLGRHPDLDGADNYVGELAEGCDRVDLLKTFLSSPERRSLIARQLARLANMDVVTS